MEYFFSRLFEEHKEMLELFSKLKEFRTREDQANSLELAEHATKVMSTLDEGIKELDDMDTFFAYLTQVGQSHKKIPGFRSEFFWVTSILIRPQCLNIYVQRKVCPNPDTYKTYNCLTFSKI